MNAAPGSTVEDQFFLRIAIKNRLLTVAQAQAIEQSLAPGQNVEELVLQRQLLDRAAVDRIRTAMAASQVMRLDALYAELLLERGLAEQHLIEAAFKEQRRQQYRVRIGNLLLGRKLISPDAHRSVISEVIRRLHSLGQDAYSSASRRGEQARDSRSGSTRQPPTHGSQRSAAPPTHGSQRSAAPPPLPPLPPSPLRPQRSAPSPPTPLGLPGGPADDPDPFGASSIEQSPLAERKASDPHVPVGLQSAPGTESSPFASRRAQSQPSSAGSGSGPVRIPLDETLPSIPSFGHERSSALFEPAARRLLREDDGPINDLTRSAIRIDLDGEGFDIKADAELLRSDLRDSVDRMADGEDSFVLDRGDLAEDGFQPEEYLKRRQTRGKLLGAAAVLGALALLGLLGSTTAQVLENRGRLTAARTMVQEALGAEGLEKQQELLQRAEQELNQIGHTGVSATDKKALSEAIAWGLLRTEVKLALAGEKPSQGLELLEKDPEAVPLAHRGEREALVTECKREQLRQEGERAEKAQDWSLAVRTFRKATTLGDPGGKSNVALAQIQSKLRKQRDQAREKLRQSLSPRDEATFKGLQRLLSELFEEPPDSSLDLETLRYQRRRARVVAQAKARLTRIEQLTQVRRELSDLLRQKADAELGLLLKKIEAQLRVRELELQGRRAEQSGDLRAAIDAYKAASKGATPGVQRQLQNAIARCEGRIQGQAARKKAVADREQAIKFLREGRPEQAVAILREIASADPRAEVLLQFAERVRGCAYVPAGKFLLGRDGGSSPEEGPQHSATTEAYYIAQTEVTNLDYAVFLDSRAPETRKSWTPRHWTQPRRRPDGQVEGKTYPSAIRSHPVIYVDWNKAQAFARWRGGRLPTETEWEKAARGTDGRTYPWGEGSRTRVQVQVRSSRTPTAPVGALADDKSPYGVYDMAGNVHEWTQSEFVPYPNAPASVQARPGRKVLRGGAWRWPLEDARTTRRQSATPEYANDRIGFRFVIDIPKDLPELR